MNAAEFAHKWIGTSNTERAVAQEHFLDLCALLNVPTPNTDREGEAYTFQKGASKIRGGAGWADVWLRGHFGWEYAGHHRNLEGAYKQLLDYREALENPPLLVVCDLDRFVIRTNFTQTLRRAYSFTLEDMRDRPAEPLRILRALFENPDALRPGRTRVRLAEEAAAPFAALTQQLRDAGYQSQRVAHFLNKLLFVLFAQDAALLPAGLLRALGENLRMYPALFTTQLSKIFHLMSHEPGGAFGAQFIRCLDGGLFDDAGALPLTTEQIDVITLVAYLDWSQIEPAVFGTLFERGLDPDKRSQLGAHYTDRPFIERVVYPVLIEPLEREWAILRADVAQLLADSAASQNLTAAGRAARTRACGQASEHVSQFLVRLNSIRVLDPACGSGNFLYVALQALKDFERSVIVWEATELGTPLRSPTIGPQNAYGIELNPYAAELAHVTLWIAEIQSMMANGCTYLHGPILRPLKNIECRDALLDLSDPSTPGESEWPHVSAIIGNPPFLGVRRMRANLGDDYVDALFSVYRGRVPHGADLVCYWHEKARAQIESGACQRVGLLATQSIRTGANRCVLDRIKETGDIYAAWSDEPWVVEGAAVRVSLVCYDTGSQKTRCLNGAPVAAINSNLSAGIDTTAACVLKDNLGIAFQGPVKVGPFEISNALAQKMMMSPNPDGRCNRDVIRPWVNALDIVRRPRNMWIIDFAENLSADEAALYEAPFAYVRQYVQPLRLTNRDRQRREHWWRLERSGRDLRAATATLARFIVTPRVSKHCIFVWVAGRTLPDTRLVAIARDDDYFFGVLHSHVHDIWSLHTGSQHGVGATLTYTPQTTFETFPFPQPTTEQIQAIARAAQDLDTLRQGWLNSEDLSPENLRERTLTRLYTQPQTWLVQAHDRLNRAVFAAYGWPYPLENPEILARLLQLNGERARSTGRAEYLLNQRLRP